MQPHAARATSRMRRARLHGQHGRQISDDGGGGDGSDDDSSDGSGSNGSCPWRRRRGRVERPATDTNDPASATRDRQGVTTPAAAGGGAGRGCGGATDYWLGGASAPRDDACGGGWGGGGAAAEPESEPDTDTAHPQLRTRAAKEQRARLDERLP